MTIDNMMIDNMMIDSMQIEVDIKMRAEVDIQIDHNKMTIMTKKNTCQNPSRITVNKIEAIIQNTGLSHVNISYRQANAVMAIIVTFCTNIQRKREGTIDMKIEISTKRDMSQEVVGAVEPEAEAADPTLREAAITHTVKSSSTMAEN